MFCAVGYFDAIVLELDLHWRNMRNRFHPYDCDYVCLFYFAGAPPTTDETEIINVIKG